jgi:hypothetical protein
VARKDVPLLGVLIAYAKTTLCLTASLSDVLVYVQSAIFNFKGPQRHSAHLVCQEQRAECRYVTTGNAPDTHDTLGVLFAALERRHMLSAGRTVASWSASLLDACSYGDQCRHAAAVTATCALGGTWALVLGTVIPHQQVMLPTHRMHRPYRQPAQHNITIVCLQGAQVLLITGPLALVVVSAI